MNAAILVSPQGKVVDTYGKMHPVPFAETIPFFEYPAVQRFFRNVVGVWNPWFMGSRYTIFNVPLQAGGSLRFGVPICFEDAFANLDRGFFLHGADMLVNVTNDSWSDTWSSEIQHFTVASFGPSRTAGSWCGLPTAGSPGWLVPGERSGDECLLPASVEDRGGPRLQGADVHSLHPFGDWFPMTPDPFLLIVLVLKCGHKKEAILSLLPTEDSLADSRKNRLLHVVVAAPAGLLGFRKIDLDVPSVHGGFIQRLDGGFRLSWLVISMNPKPLDLPVCRSLMTLLVSTTPYGVNN